jgi:hypothetical protein
VAATSDDFCAICVLDGRCTRSIEWPGAPICRECLAKAIEENGSARAPICRDIAKRIPQPAPSPSLGIRCATLQ